MQIKVASFAVICESQDFFLACIASPPARPRGAVVEFELTSRVEGVSEDVRGCCNCACFVQVEVTPVARVFEADSSFFAAITVEGSDSVFELQPFVLWMSWMVKLLVNLHIV